MSIGLQNFVALQKCFQQLYRALLRWIIRPQLTPESAGEDGFFHGIDLLHDGFGGFPDLLFLGKEFIKSTNNFTLFFIQREWYFYLIEILILKLD